MTFPVVTEGRFTTPQEFEDIILRTDPNGVAIVRLKDVGRAEVGLKDYLLRSKLNGKPATLIAIYQQPGSNSLAVAKNVRQTLGELKGKFPQGLDYTVSLDTTKFVKASIKEVEHTLFEAVLLVLAVVFLFSTELSGNNYPYACGRCFLVRDVYRDDGVRFLDQSPYALRPGRRHRDRGRRCYRGCRGR